MIFVYDKDGITAWTDPSAKWYYCDCCMLPKVYSFSIPQIRKLWPGKINSGVSILHNTVRQHVAQSVIDLFIDYARKHFTIHLIAQL